MRSARLEYQILGCALARDMNDQEVVAAYARVAGPGWLVFVELPIGE